MIQQIGETNMPDVFENSDYATDWELNDHLEDLSFDEIDLDDIGE